MYTHTHTYIHTYTHTKQTKKKKKMFRLSLCLLLVVLLLFSIVQNVQSANYGKLHEAARNVVHKNLPPTMSSHRETLKRAHGIKDPDITPPDKEKLAKTMEAQHLKKKRQQEKELGMNRLDKKQRALHAKYRRRHKRTGHRT